MLRQDRKDMYYQCAVSRQRAASNVLGPSWRRDQLAAFPEELQDFDAGELEARTRARSRLEGCDRFLIPELQQPPSGVDALHACLGSEAMRDHAGVDFVQAGHDRLLEGGPPRSRLGGRRPFPYASRYEWLCIDDYISVGRVPISQLLPAPSQTWAAPTWMPSTRP